MGQGLLRRRQAQSVRRGVSTQGRFSMPSGLQPDYPFSARVILEGFYCNRRYAAATSLTADGLAAQLVNIRFQACFPPSRLRASVSHGVSEFHHKLS